MRRYLASLPLVVVASALGAAGREHFAAPDLVMLYLAVIAVVAGYCGRGPALVASGLSVLAYDYLFVPPLFTLHVAEKRHLLTFAMMFTVGLVTSGITLRMRRQERERARLVGEAQAAALRARTEEMRSSLLSAVSHDLRTPLGAIIGAATTLRNPPAGLDAVERGELLDTICEEAVRLERLVSNLLDMTRLESGGLAVKREWVPLEEVVGSALERLGEQIAGRPIETDLPADLPLIAVDPVLIEQVFVNLIDNAAKYTPAGSPIEISARALGASVRVDVSDHGPGVDPEDAHRIFEKFSRGRHRGIPGAGLGLAICRGVVGAHGGSLSVENKTTAGACFRVTLPLLGDAPAVPREETREAGTAP